MSEEKGGAGEMLTVPEAAAAKGVHPHSVRRAIKAQRLKALRKGNYWLIDRADLERWTVIGHRPKKTA
jgi:excisionase family DNA binding protein